MKRACILYVVITLILSSCEDKNKLQNAAFDLLNVQSDSLTKLHLRYEKTYQMMVQEHKQFKEQLGKLKVKDSTLLINFAKHTVILQRQDAYINEHKEIITGHKELKANFRDLSDIEIKAQMEEMEEGHRLMVKQHKEMNREHGILKKEHAFMKREIAKEMDIEREQ